jgi:hypothetical protein
MKIGPHHLAKFDTTPNPNFDSEVVYRRCPFGNKSASATVQEFFLDIRWEDILDGISVNRSKYASPEDALWAFEIEDPEKKECSYSERKGKVLGSEAEHYPTGNDPKTGVSFCLAHTPINCNISHCDILVENLPLNPTKGAKRDIKAFLATFFRELSPDENTKSTPSAELGGHSDQESQV